MVCCGNSIEGIETICMSGVAGIFYFEQQSGRYNGLKRCLFDKEVSEFCFIDLDGDGKEELVTIEPFHGEALNVYKRKGQQMGTKIH
jgi:hypothetical protein